MLIHNQFQLGPLTLFVSHDKRVIHGCKVHLTESTNNLSEPGPVSDLSASIAEQVAAYSQHRRATFELPLAEAGSDFQRRVWEQLCLIPAGQALTYGQLASKLNTAAQPVGGACKTNPVAFFVPCHRVVGAQAIGGYAGAWGEGPTIEVKRWLLEHEAGFNRATH